MKILRAELPELFAEISEFIIEHSKEEHRRGSTFFTKSIIQFKQEDAKHFSGIKNFSEYVGLWETNQYIASEEDIDWDEIDTLTRVEKKKVMIESFEWQPI